MLEMLRDRTNKFEIVRFHRQKTTPPNKVPRQCQQAGKANEEGIKAYPVNPNKQANPNTQHHRALKAKASTRDAPTATLPTTNQNISGQGYAE